MLMTPSLIYFATKLTQDNVAELLERIARCIAEIRQWMRANFLKLNDDKTEILLFGSFHQLKKVTIDSTSIGEVSINLSSMVRNLGILLDPSMSMVTHISSISSSAHFHLRNIARIRPFLSEKSTEQLVHAFITSKLDMGNSLLFGLPEYQINRLQKIQNHAARLVTKTPGTMHITPVLKHLHWFPIRQRIEYKLLLHVYRALSGQGPSYMSDLVQQYIQPDLCVQLLVLPRTHSTSGDRAFSSAAPRLWNSLPIGGRPSTSLQIFKRRLKTYLFGYAFGDF